MGTYIPNTEKEQSKMLEAAGYKDFEDLFSCIPEELIHKKELNLPEGKSEMQVLCEMEGLAEKNKVLRHVFRGAGAYNHYIPAIVKSVVSKEEFITAYTPYQAEISQGILQSIFEYQTDICELTGMDVANASVYDAGTAAAEAVNMCRDRKHSGCLVSEAVLPQVSGVIKTYCFAGDTPYQTIPLKDGVTDTEELEHLLSENSGTACVYIQNPNYFGLFEDVEKIAQITHEHGAKLVVGVNPISLGIVKTPGESGADIAVGDGQPLGLPLGFGGPYIGFMACRKELMRNLPGRIVGQTEDSEGHKAFVLTLQAREQHIRREKAGSNICSNEALCALTAGVYLAAMGADGLEKTALHCMSKAAYLKNALEKIGFSPVFDRPFFHEFVTECPADASLISAEMEQRGYLTGLPIDNNRLLWCATEKNTKDEIDGMITVLKEVLAK